MPAQYSWGHAHSAEGSFWEIIDTKKGPYPGKIIFRYPFDLERDFGLDEPPPVVRKEYERLIGWKQGTVRESPVNVVEIIAGDDCAFDQPCRFAYRVEQHAVYCHNQTWLYAPGKCRRCSKTGDGHEDCHSHATCPGYEPSSALTSENKE